MTLDNPLTIAGVEVWAAHSSQSFRFILFFLMRPLGRASVWHFSNSMAILNQNLSQSIFPTFSFPSCWLRPQVWTHDGSSRINRAEQMFSQFQLWVTDEPHWGNPSFHHPYLLGSVEGNWCLSYGSGVSVDDLLCSPLRVLRICCVVSQPLLSSWLERADVIDQSPFHLISVQLFDDHLCWCSASEWQV